jgi:Flp pilus assembly pilin Flp
MLKRVTNFLKNEHGAVTVDWVVLCAGIVALVVAIFTSMQTGALGLADSIKLFMN